MTSEYYNYVEYLKGFATKNIEAYNNRVIPTSSKMFGIKTSILKCEAKKLIKSHSIEEINKLLFPNEYYEVDMIRGFCTAYYKGPTALKIAYLQKYIETINNWATCDQTICATSFLQKELPDLYLFTQELLKDEHEYVCRAGLILLLKYFVIDEYFKELPALLKEVKINDYYVEMGLAWLLSKMYVCFPIETYHLLENDVVNEHHYTASVILKAIQKIVDSFRASAEEKEKVKKLRNLIRKNNQ